VLSDTLALWPLDDGAGQTVRDIGPNALHGTLGQSSAVESVDPAWTSLGRFGVGLSLSRAQTDYVYVPTAVPYPANRYTLELWVRPNAGYAQVFTSGFINNFLAFDPSGYIEWGVGDDNDWTFQNAPATITAGEWHYMAVTYNGATLTSYVDGALVASTPASRVMGIPLEYYLGGRPSNTFLDGVLGPIRLSSTVHTASDIATTWTNSRACPAP
jgi:hypothetical protein